MLWKGFELKETSKALNRLAREKMKLKLLQDIRVDIEVCKLEEFDYKEYLKEIKDIIDSFLRMEQL